LAERLSVDRAVAVGEIGLDFKIDVLDADRQLGVLAEQIGLAVDLDLPVILHCRGAFEEMIRVLERHSPRVRGVVHAYSRGPELACRLVELGFHLGLGGAITRPKARRARRSAQSVPLDRIVLETDAPSIGLDGVPPDHTEPRHVAMVAQALAELRNEPISVIAQRTTETARSLFELDQ
jgi:TatD DNase family protein